ncbi:phosphatidylinositol-binding protein scs2 [Actinomortierella ambigua]|nr:phosphatidylinositol-binding protein scs2 [Actinomortierella ambigua]
MSIEIDPSSQLAFRRPLTSVIKQTLTIRNTSQLPVAFKVKTTAPKQYCVRPNSGRISPGQVLEVQVQLQPMKEDPPMDFKCRDKFLVQSIAITAEREQLAPADLFYFIVQPLLDTSNNTLQPHPPRNQSVGGGGEEEGFGLRQECIAGSGFTRWTIELLARNATWPTVEREAKDQIREKKLRCVYLPPLAPQIAEIEEEEDEQPQHPPAYSTSSLSSVARSENVPEPVDAPAEEPAAVVPSSPSPSPVDVPASSMSSEAVNVLKHELEQAKDIIQNLRASNEKLQQEANSFRQRRTEPITAASTAPTMTAVQVKQPQGYPASYVAAAALIAFIFAWLFF